MKFTSGMIIGSIIGASATMVSQANRHNRRRMRKTGRKMMNKAEEVIDNIMDMM